MKLSTVNETFEHKITEGGEYQWNCYPNARFLDYESEFAYVSVIYSTLTQAVYQVEVSVIDTESDSNPYRWINPTFKDQYYLEAKSRNVDPMQAWDDYKYIELEVEEDFLEKAKAIFNGEVFDTRILVPLDIEDSLLFELMKKAHEKDITLNKLMEDVLQSVINRGIE